MLDPGLGGRIALITGANRRAGIGAATARALAAQGVAVFLHYWRTPEMTVEVPGPYASDAAATPDALLEEIRARGGRADAWEADLADPRNVSTLFERVETTFGPVEILVHNATHWEPDTFLPPAEERRARPLSSWPPEPSVVSVEGHDRHFAVSSRAAALLLAQYARRHLARRASWGRVVGLTTTGAGGFPREVSYGASKNALESYTRAFALELAPYGVTANLLDPGATQTGWITPELEREITPRIPMQRVASPEEVADVILLLCSEQARLLTAQRLHGLGGSRLG